MNCSHFAAMLADFQEGKLPPGDRSAAEAHLRNCAHCRRLLEVVGGKIDVLAEDGGALARSIIAQTSGPACRYVLPHICAYVDREADEADTYLVGLHLAYCKPCRSLADALVTMREILPEMAGIEPGEYFTRSVIAATSAPRRSRPSLGTKLPALWNSLVQRPRFSFEAAYLGTLALVFAFGNPTLPFQSAALDKIGARAVQHIRIESGAQLLAAGLSDARAPVLVHLRNVAASASLTEQALAGSLNDFTKRYEQKLLSVFTRQFQGIETWGRRGTAALRSLRAYLSSRISPPRS